MEKTYRFKFKDQIAVPKRTYDLDRYKNYIDYLLDKERDDEPCYHCFAIFDDELLQKIVDILDDNCYCNCEPITMDDLEEIN